MKVYIKIPVEKDFPTESGKHFVFNHEDIKNVATLSKEGGDFVQEYETAENLTHYLKEIDLSDFMVDFYGWWNKQEIELTLEEAINNYFTEKGYIQL